jgi:hypothetical protein
MTSQTRYDGNNNLVFKVTQVTPEPAIRGKPMTIHPFIAAETIVFTEAKF